MIKTVAVAIIASLSIVPSAYADYIGEQLAKAEKRVSSAQTNLAKWQECAADRATCLEDLRQRAAKAAANAQKRVDALK